MSFLWESWLQQFTNQREEAVINPVRQKDIANYKQLMKAAFIELRRVLKPEGAMTVVFSNSSSAVWASVVEAIAEAGFDVTETAVLEKRQPSIKQLTAPNVVGLDVVLTARPSAQPLSEPVRAVTAEELPDLIAKVLSEQRPPMPIRTLFAHVVARAVRMGASLGSDYSEFRSFIYANMPQVVAEEDRPYSVNSLRSKQDSEQTRLSLEV
jgi:adenine-specific DNA methylase